MFHYLSVVMAEKSKFWYLKGFNIFEGMEESQMKKVEKMTAMSQINKHRPIYFPEQPSTTIYFLKEGHVKLSRLHEDGREVILDVLGPGELFGELSIVDDEGRKEIAEALDNVLVCTISKADFEELINYNPSMNLQLTKWIGLRLRKFEEKVSELAFKDVTKRIISFLVRYAESFGKIKSGVVSVKSFLSQEEIAHLTAASRQTVTTVLNDLKSQGLIDFSRKDFIIKNFDKLRQLSN
ncbi:MAG: Crp/Fnr family transcriptional regulator [Ignavibacteriae bacterium]|nr:Crp/Fnr family transcriptional regulator [Ignavibacteriota bacterium]